MRQAQEMRNRPLYVYNSCYLSTNALIRFVTQIVIILEKQRHISQTQSKFFTHIFSCEHNQKFPQKFHQSASDIMWQSAAYHIF